jgi:hypothetical protein
MKDKLSGFLSSETIGQITSSSYAMESMNLSTAQTEKVLDAYMSGMHDIFIMYAPIIGICFICAVLIKDEGVAEKDANQQPPAPKLEQSVESSDRVVMSPEVREEKV